LGGLDFAVESEPVLLPAFSCKPLKTLDFGRFGGVLLFACVREVMVLELGLVVD
jgi:hypothetical protein